jgi:Family of unknown function (DUF6134)
LLRAPLAAAALCSLSPLLAADTADGSAAALRQWHFAVLLDGKPIGWHDFTVTGAGADAEVEIHADFKVTALLIPVYTYQHWNHERWRGGCLSQIDARTRDNGHEYLVHGQLSAHAFEVQGPQGPAALHGCIKSFAYWDASTLEEKQLLNSQTGEYEAVSVNHTGSETLSVAGHSVTSEHYALVGRHYTIELWYSPQGEWLALQTHTDGRTVRYELRP